LEQGGYLGTQIFDQCVLSLRSRASMNININKYLEQEPIPKCDVFALSQPMNVAIAAQIGNGATRYTKLSLMFFMHIFRVSIRCKSKHRYHVNPAFHSQC
jgi:hypothetical protein